MIFKPSFQILATFFSKCSQIVGFWPGVKRFFYECVACVCLTIGTILLLNAFFMALGFLIGVLIISFALPIGLYKSLWTSENGSFTKI